MVADQIQPTLTIDNLNPHIKVMEFVIRGPLFIRAGEIQEELKKGVKKPFTEIINANIGDCHAMGQTPITFIRQMLALVTYPKLFEDSSIPEDVKKRAKLILQTCRGSSTGSYTDPSGIDLVKKHAAEYIEKRDGIPTDWQNIVITAGASVAIMNVLRLLSCEVNGKRAGVMVPIPQYPIYSALLSEFNMHQIGYYLDESKNWSLDMNKLHAAISEARKVSNPRAIVIINPGNPCGQLLSRENIEEIIKFAYKERLFILADEVYQENVYAEGSKFYSFKKVMMEMGAPYCNMELASFMSCSKGYMGECGVRGGYVEVINMDPTIKLMFLKANSTMLCPTVYGQICLDAVMNPPQVGEPSYDQFIKEKTAVLDSLKSRAKMVVDAFNSMEGFSCNLVQGSMYAFPRIKLPPKAIEAAKNENKTPDDFYAFELLEQTGICVFPGCNFDQKPGTYHFRSTILPQSEKLKIMLDKFKKFNANFMKKYN